MEGGEDEVDKELKCDPTIGKPCIYQYNKDLKIEIPCECALHEDQTDIGYCPIPKEETLQEYIKRNIKIWDSDNCHTLDRDNLIA